MDKFTVARSIGRSWRRKDSTTRRWTQASKVVLGLSLTIACQSALAQATYRIKPLSLLGGCTSSAPVARGLNAAGQVTGTACNAHGDTHAFLWRNDGTSMVDLGPNEVGSTSEGVALNAAGLVAGDAQDSTGEFGFVSSGDGTPMSRIHDSLGGNAIYPRAINDLGQLTGYADLGYADLAGDTVEHAFVWKNDGSPILDLDPLRGNSSLGNAINASGQVTGIWGSQAFVWKNDGTPIFGLGRGSSPGAVSIEAYGSAINAAGQVAGGTFNDNHGLLFRRIFFWRNDGTPMQVLGTLGGTNSFLAALNDAGQVVGVSDMATVARHAFVWLNNGLPMNDLGTLGGTNSGASDINSSGQVTGTAYLAGNKIAHAFLWRNDSTAIQDLNTLIDATDPLKSYVTLTSGDFINDRGDILVRGTDRRTGLQGLYLLHSTVLTLSPRSLAFGNHPIHTTSAAKSVTMTNTSANVVAITNIALKGSGSTQFTSTNNCGSSLVGHATCTIKVTFKPTTKGAIAASLKVPDGGGGLYSVHMTGTGT
jgi:probable HAF family extracellular repeat protein